MLVTYDPYGHFVPEGVTQYEEDNAPVVQADVAPKTVTTGSTVYSDALQFFQSLIMCDDATDDDLDSMSRAVWRILEDSALSGHAGIAKLRGMTQSTAFAVACSTVLEMASHCMVVTFTNAPVFCHVGGIDMAMFDKAMRDAFEIPTHVQVAYRINPQVSKVYVRFTGRTTLIDYMRIRLAAEPIDVTLTNPDNTVTVKSVLGLDNAYGLFTSDINTLADAVTRRLSTN
jgi:hypothetical protein